MLVLGTLTAVRMVHVWEISETVSAMNSVTTLMTVAVMLPMCAQLVRIKLTMYINDYY